MTLTPHHHTERPVVLHRPRTDHPRFRTHAVDMEFDSLHLLASAPYGGEHDVPLVRESGNMHTRSSESRTIDTPAQLAAVVRSRNHPARPRRRTRVVRTRIRALLAHPRPHHAVFMIPAEFMAVQPRALLEGSSLAVSALSGRPARCGRSDSITREAYSHE